MGNKPLFYIYGRKEMFVLVLLGLMVALFAFTLGVHLGKKVGLVSENPISHHQAATEKTPLQTTEDALPDRIELKEQSKNVQAAADSAISQALHDEVVKTGIQLDTPRQVELPGETKLEKTKLEKSKLEKSELEKSEEDTRVEANKEVKTHAHGAAVSVPDQLKTVSKKTFSLQVGSHPSFELAKDHVESLEALGAQAFFKSAQVSGKRWFRVYLGQYSDPQSAKDAGGQLKKQHVIDTFVVAPTPQDEGE